MLIIIVTGFFALLLTFVSLFLTCSSRPFRCDYSLAFASLCALRRRHALQELLEVVLLQLLRLQRRLRRCHGRLRLRPTQSLYKLPFCRVELPVGQRAVVDRQPLRLLVGVGALRRFGYSVVGRPHELLDLGVEVRAALALRRLRVETERRLRRLSGLRRVALDDLVVVDRVLLDFVERPHKAELVVEFLVFRNRLIDYRMVLLIRRYHVANQRTF